MKLLARLAATLIFLSGVADSFVHAPPKTRGWSVPGTADAPAAASCSRCPLLAGDQQRSAIATGPVSERQPPASGGLARRPSPTSLGSKGRSGGEDEADSSIPSRSLDRVGGLGSNILVFISAFLVLKGLFLPEDVRHLSFCPPDDPVRGRDTLPWKMMEESGRECGDINEVMFKYVTAPIAIPGTPEWGEMLNVKEDRMKEGW